MSTLQKSVRSLLIFATAAVVCSVGSAQEPSEQPARSQAEARRPQGTTSDQSFVKEAAEGGLAEVELGQLATEKTSNPEVKRFAQRMINDHSKANDQLKQIAVQKGIDLPTEPSGQAESDQRPPFQVDRRRVRQSVFVKHGERS
jgi:putative membrane protein